MITRETGTKWMIVFWHRSLEQCWLRHMIHWSLYINKSSCTQCEGGLCYMQDQWHMAAKLYVISHTSKTTFGWHIHNWKSTVALIYVTRLCICSDYHSFTIFGALTLYMVCVVCGMQQTATVWVNITIIMALMKERVSHNTECVPTTQCNRSCPEVWSINHL